MEEAKLKIKDQILHCLKMQGAQTANTLAAQLGVSPMAIRQHLQQLQAERWVTYCEEKRPMGRPVKLWSLTPRTQVRFPDSHAELMQDVLRSIAALWGEEGLDRLIADRSSRQIAAYREKITERGASTWQQQVEAIADLRTQEGYMAEVIEQNGALLLVENHCPICVAAQSCQQLCRAEREVFQVVLGPQLRVQRVEHLLRGDRRCAYLIEPCED